MDNKIMKLPHVDFKPLETHSYKELVEVIISNPQAKCFLTYLRCKYSHETEYEYLIEPCCLYNFDDILWFNDWDEGQRDVEYLAIAVVELKEEDND